MKYLKKKDYKKNIKDFNIEIYINPDRFRLDINQRNFIHLRGELKELNKHLNNMKFK